MSGAQGPAERRVDLLAALQRPIDRARSARIDARQPGAKGASLTFAILDEVHRQDAQQPATAPESTSGQSGTSRAENVWESGEGRVRKYRAAIFDPGAHVERQRVVAYANGRTAWETLLEWQARAVLAVADAEQAALRAEVERLTHRLAKAEGSRDMALDSAKRRLTRAEKAEAERDRLAATLAQVRAEVERLHPRKTNVRHGCCAPPRLCEGHADECGGSHAFNNRPAYPCADLRSLRAVLDAASEEKP